jgi:hypothetical protein
LLLLQGYLQDCCCSLWLGSTASGSKQLPVHMLPLRLLLLLLASSSGCC